MLEVEVQSKNSLFLMRKKLNGEDNIHRPGTFLYTKVTNDIKGGGGGD